VKSDVRVVQVFTEMVRLTNDNAVREHTDEDGDLFLWFKHQASQGIVGAQVTTDELSRVMWQRQRRIFCLSPSPWGDRKQSQHLTPKSLYPKQDLDPFSRIFMVQSRYRQAYRLTHHAHATG